jgi:hypothetical protein
MLILMLMLMLMMMLLLLGRLSGGRRGGRTGAEEGRGVRHCIIIYYLFQKMLRSEIQLSRSLSNLSRERGTIGNDSTSSLARERK